MIIKHNQRLNDIYNQYINDEDGQEMNANHIFQLNHTYKQFLRDDYTQDIEAVIGIREIIKELVRLNIDADLLILKTVASQYYMFIEDILLYSDNKQDLNTNYKEYLDAIFYNQHMTVVDEKNPNEYYNQTVVPFNRLFINYLNDKSIYDMINQQFINDNRIEHYIAGFRQNSQNMEYHEMPVGYKEYINSSCFNYTRSLYFILLDELNTRYLHVIQEPLDSVTDPDRAELYKTYIQSINNIYFNQYISQYLYVIYFHCIKDDSDDQI